MKRKWQVHKSHDGHDGHDEHEEDDVYPTELIYNERNHIYFNGPITEISSAILNRTLRKTCKEQQHINIEYGLDSELILHINSPGGDITASWSIVDTINSLPLPVNTVIEGYVASAGTLISLAGKKRYMTRNAYVMIHELSSSVWGRMSAIECEVQNLVKMMEQIRNYYIEKTKIKQKKLDKLLLKDMNFNLEEAIKMGIVDEEFN